MSDELNMEAERAAFEAWANAAAIRTDLGAWDAWLAARRAAPVSAPMGTNGEAIPLPPLESLMTYDPERDSPGLMEWRNKYNDGDYFKVEDVRNWFAPYAERIRHLERELEDTKANLHTAVQQAWTANASLSQAKRELEQSKAAFQGSENARQGELDAVNRILFGDQATVEAERRARKDAERARETVQSIRTLEFVSLMNAWRKADPLTGPAAYDAIIAYIDGRTAGTVPKLYTCIGKGGEYELVGEAIPAGVLSSTLMVSSYSVYRNISSGKMFVRTSSDFYQRMTQIAAAPTPLNWMEKAK